MSLTAFLVEDNPVIRDNLRAALQEMVPLDVVGWAQDEASALAWLGEPANRCDVVIIDLFIENGSGVSVLSAIKAKRLPVRTVVLSNYSHGEMERRCVELGADRVFDKSSQIDELIEFCASLDPLPPAADDQPPPLQAA